MKFTTFNRGEWGEADPPIPGDYLEGTDREIDNTLAAGGFSISTEIGDFDAGFVCKLGRLYRSDGDEWEYLLDMDVGHEFHSKAILVKDLPSLLELARLAEPLWRMGHEAYRTERLLMAIEKAFEAWHGHDLEDVCRECSRFEYDRREARRRERREREAKRTAAQAK